MVEAHVNRLGVEDGAVRDPAVAEMPPNLRPGSWPSEEERRSAEVVTSTSALSALGGAGAVVLCIISLAGIMAVYLGPIAAIAIGGALLVEAAGVATRYQRLVHETYGAVSRGNLSIGTGMGAESIGGAAAIVLGILALIGILPLTLMACAVIVVGATALLGTSALVRLNHFVIGASTAHPRVQEAAHGAVTGSADAQALAGIGAIVLGILALVGFAPGTLILVGLLAVGAGLMLSGSALAGRLAGIMAR